MITLIVTFVVGFVVGILVGRNNAAKVNRAVEDSVELYEKAQAEIAELKAQLYVLIVRQARVGTNVE